MNKKNLSLLKLIGVILMSLAVVNPVFAELPPRPTPPTAVPSSAPQGANIVLQTQAGMWSVVQWQDVNGNWNDVEGWRGTVGDGFVKWWVAQKDFGTGPFRWAVSPYAGSEFTSAGDAFYLPSVANETLIIAVP